jgi:MoaA/NifB/PqqE/SkfB family radical SAM enzyme
MLKCCSEAGKHVLLSTNGYNTRRTLRALDAAACTILAVSLHGPPVVHDRYVGMVGSYQRAVATLTSAAANGHLVHVLTIATAETLPSLRELALSLTDSAIVEHRINLIRPAGRIAVGLVAYDEVSNAIDGLQVGHKLSVKRRDQPLLFLNHLGTLEVRCERRY